jgi:N4-gp56 family major capsid protein
MRTALIADATADYPGTISTVATVDYPQHEISYADLVKMSAYLEAQSARPPSGGYFPVIIHPYTWASLMQDATFVVMFVKEVDPIRTGSVGTLLNMQFFVTSNAYSVAGTLCTTVYSALFIGAESYVAVGIAGLEPKDVDNMGPGKGNLTGQSLRPVEMIAHGPGSAGTGDPLDQRGTIAWKMTMGQDVLNSSWITNLYHSNVYSDD